MTAVYSIINIQKLHQDADLDPEHYHPERMGSSEKIHQISSQNISDFFDEILFTVEGNEESEVYNLTDALGNFLSPKGERSALSSKKIALPGDIIVSKLRTYLKEICVIPSRYQGFAPQISTEFLVFRPKDSNGNWLLSYLLTDDVQTILKWSQTGNSHPRIRSPSILSMPVPRKVIEKRNEINEIINEAISHYENNINNYSTAEEKLLNKIELNYNYNTNSELFYIEDYINTKNNERLDAEHYHPKYKRLIEKIKVSNFKTIEEISDEPIRGVQPEYYEEGEVLVINSKAVWPIGIDFNKLEKTTLDFYDKSGNEKSHVFKGDVLLNSTGVGTIGRASYVDLDSPAMVDNHVTIIRPNVTICIPEYLSLFLNSPGGLAQSEMFSTGSSGQLEIYPKHIKKIIIPLPLNEIGDVDINWQFELSQLVKNTSCGKIESSRLLQNAIQSINDLIETEYTF